MKVSAKDLRKRFSLKMAKLVKTCFGIHVDSCVHMSVKRFLKCRFRPGVGKYSEFLTHKQRDSPVTQQCYCLHWTRVGGLGGKVSWRLPTQSEVTVLRYI